MPGGEGRSSADAVIRSIAAQQHGVVARGQLLAAGVASHVIDQRVVTGSLVPLHRGVYRAGALLGTRYREMAAVLACGANSAVARWGAANILRILPVDAALTASVEVIVAGADRGHRPGIHALRVCRIGDDEITTVDGVPVTTAARTILDLAGGVATTRQLEQALATAERECLVTRKSILELLARYPRRAGSGTLRQLLARPTAAFTRSKAEEIFLALVRKGGLPGPETNVRLHGAEVDCLWRTHRLVVEIDGFAYHGSARAFELDRQRDARLTAAGMRVMRVTWQQLIHEPEGVLVRVAQALVHSVRPG